MIKPDIGLVYPDYFREDFGEIVTKDIRHEKLNLHIKQQEPQVWGSIEWVIPGIIAAYLFKPYFTGFLNEAGKDHYQYLKNCLTKLLKLAKDLPVKTLTSDKSGEKVNRFNTQSKAISIHVELKNGTRIKIMFDNDLSEDEWLYSLNNMLTSIENHYEKFPEDELSQKISGLGFPTHNEIFAIINKGTKKWEFMDLKQVLKQYQNLKK